MSLCLVRQSLYFEINGTTSVPKTPKTIQTQRIVSAISSPHGDSPWGLLIADNVMLDFDRINVICQPVKQSCCLDQQLRVRCRRLNFRCQLAVSLGLGARLSLEAPAEGPGQQA